MPFSPTDIAGLGLWLKADAGTLDDSSNPCTNGEGVATWQDQSGTGNDATQASDPNQPIYTTGAINGLPALLFDGLLSGMTWAGATGLTDTGGSIFVVLQSSNPSVTNAIPFFVGPSGGLGFQFVSGTRTVLYSSGGFGDGSTTGSAEYWSWLGASSSSTFRVTGIPQTGGGSGPFSAPSPGGNIGADFGGFNWPGYIAEILVYNSTLSLADLESVESYLATKWGLAVGLYPPTALTANEISPTEIDLMWTVPPAYNTFNVYRGATPGGEGGTPLATGITGNTYADTSVTPGNTYYYTVTTVLGANESAFSNEASASTMLSPYATQVLSDGAVAYYRLGEPNQTINPGVTVMADSSGNVDDGVYDDPTVVLGVTGALSGDPDTAATFTQSSGSQGANGGMGLVNYADGLSAISIELWAKMSSPQPGASGDFVFFAGWDGSADVFLGTDDAGNVVFALSTTMGFPIADSGSTLSDGAYHHVVGTFDGTNVIIYVDGVSAGSTTIAPDTIDAGTGGFVVAIPDSPATYDGTLDEIAVYPTALSSAQVLNHYLLGIGAMTVDAVGEADGDSSASGVGGSTADSVGTAAGSSTANGVGSSFFDSVGTAAGSSTALGVGQAIPPSGTGNGGGFFKIWGGAID